MEPQKVFFIPGDLVTIRQRLESKPIMIVKEKVAKMIREVDSSHFKGIRCFWFSSDLKYQEAIFNTKDLIHID